MLSEIYALPSVVFLYWKTARGMMLYTMPSHVRALPLFLAVFDLSNKKEFLFLICRFFIVSKCKRNVQMFECWNGGLGGLEGLESLEFRVWSFILSTANY